VNINQSNGRDTLPDGVTPSPFIVKRYANAYITYSEYTLSMDTEIIMNFIAPVHAVPVDEEVFASIILPLIQLPDFILLVIRGLANPYCPANVLSAAFRSTRPEYRRIAATHPNCPVEDAVYATLMNSGGVK
jgi:hypothetical protein